MNAEPHLPFDVHERLRLIRDSLINNSSYLISGVVGILLVPILLHGLGAELYGLWIAVLAVASVIQVVDFGLGLSVAREVAAAQTGQGQEEAARFVAAAGRAYLILGGLGGVLLFLFGLPLSGGLQLSPQGRTIAPLVFGLAALAFAADQMLGFATWVLHGLRRFDKANLFSIVAILLRAAGFIVLLALGAGLVSIASWAAVTSTLMASAAVVFVGRLEPHYRLRGGRIEWASLRAHLPFGFTVQLTRGVNSIVWSAAPILIGLLRGSAAIVPYHIGAKFPVAVTEITARGAGVLFPAASEQERAGSLVRMQEILEVGTRWIVVIALPLCLVLWLLAPNLLQAWLGEPPPAAAEVMRLVTIAVFLEAIGASALQVLWGRGAARAVLEVLLGVAIATVGLSVWLLARLGTVGAAWGLLFPVSVGSLTLLHLASRACGVRALGLLRSVARGLLLPIVACGATTAGILYFTQAVSWPGVIATALAGGMAYAASFYWSGAREEERLLAHELLRFPATVLLRLRKGQ